MPFISGRGSIYKKDSRRGHGGPVRDQRGQGLPGQIISTTISFANSQLHIHADFIACYRDIKIYILSEGEKAKDVTNKKHEFTS